MGKEKLGSGEWKVGKCGVGNGEWHTHSSIYLSKDAVLKKSVPEVAHCKFFISSIFVNKIFQNVLQLPFNLISSDLFCNSYKYISTQIIYHESKLSQ